MLTHPYQYAWHHFWPCKCADLGELNPLLTLKPVCWARDTGIACSLLLGASLVFLNGLSCYRSIIYGLMELYSCFIHVFPTAVHHITPENILKVQKYMFRLYIFIVYLKFDIFESTGIIELWSEERYCE